ncbi:tellurite resistance TerB family protein, partial [Bordetella pertussis]
MCKETAPEMGAEMYLASLLVADEQSFMERAYLDELARQLKLPAELKQQLEAQVPAAA